MKRPDSSLVALTVGALGSAAANTAWTWEAGPVRVIAGLFTTALVPVAMHLWNQVPVTGRWTRFLRFVVMAYICGAAAVVNLAHAVMLLTDQRNERAEHIVLAVLSITAVEALMVMASLARRKPATPVSHPTAVPAPTSAVPPLPVEREAPHPSVIASAVPVGHAVGAGAPVMASHPATDALAHSPAPAGVPPVLAGEPVGRQWESNGEEAVGDVAPPAVGAPVENSAPVGRETVGGEPSHPAEWAAWRVSQGLPAGRRKLREQFPTLTEAEARTIARDAAEAGGTGNGGGLHLVGRAVNN